MPLHQNPRTGDYRIQPQHQVAQRERLEVAVLEAVEGLLWAAWLGCNNDDKFQFNVLIVNALVLLN
jgi:hypothetical protein